MYCLQVLAIPTHWQMYDKQYELCNIKSDEINYFQINTLILFFFKFLTFSTYLEPHGFIHRKLAARAGFVWSVYMHFKYQNIQNCNFACCFVWVRNLVVDIAGGEEAEGV
jgi:hypothetical protein